VKLTFRANLFPPYTHHSSFFLRRLLGHLGACGPSYFYFNVLFSFYVDQNIISFNTICFSLNINSNTSMRALIF